MATLQKSRTRRLKFKKRSRSTVRILLSNTIPKSRCIQCSNPLHGISAVTRKQLKKLNRSQKRAQRQHPDMCAACSRRAIINKVRSSVENSTANSIGIPEGRRGLIRETQVALMEESSHEQS